MATFNFNTSLGQSLTFNPSADVLSIGYPATQVSLTQSGSNTVVTVDGVGSVTLSGISIGQLHTTLPTGTVDTIANIGVAGGVLLIGDETTSTALDNLPNSGLTGGTGSDVIFGLGGGDAINTGTNGDDIVYGGAGATDSTDGGDTITVATVRSARIYANAGNDAVNLTGVTTAGISSSIWGGLGNDSVTFGAGDFGGDYTVLLADGDDSYTDAGSTSVIGKVTVSGGVGNDVINVAKTSSDTTVYGGSGETDTADGGDTITIGVGSSVVYGNAGNDVVATGASTASKTVAINAGIGNDTITTGAGVATSFATITGGSGDDIINSSAHLGNVTLYGGTGVADSTDGADTISLGSGNTTVYANAGNDVINITTALAASKTVNAFTGTGNDVVNISGAHDTTAKVNLTLATGNQTINYNANPTGGADAGYLTTISNFDGVNDKINVTLDGGSSATALVVSSGFVFNDADANGTYSSATEEAISFSGYTGDFNTTNFVLSDGSRLITNTAGATAATLTGTSAADHLIAGNLGDTLVGGGGTNRLVGGSGADTIRLTVTEAQALDTAGWVLAGSGTDTLEIVDSSAITLLDNDWAAARVTGVEVLKLNNITGQSVTIATNAVTAGLNTVDASALTGTNTATVAAGSFASALTYRGAAGVDTLTMGSGIDNIATNDGNDSITIGAADLTGSDTINGGAGTDTLTISTASASFTNSTFANITGIETLTLGNFANSVSLGAAASTTGITIINGNAAIDTINLTGATTGVRVNGLAAADVITDGSGNDTIDGGAGIDTITLLTGGGSDVVASAGAAFAGNSTANSDTITGFTIGTDTFDFASNLLNGTFTASSNISAQTVVAQADATAVTANGVIFAFTSVADQLAAATDASNVIARAVTALTNGTDFGASNMATGDSVLVLLDDGTNSFLLHYTADATAATTAAADLELVAIFNGISDVTAFTAGVLI